MNEALKKTLDLFIANRAELYPEMTWEVASNAVAIMSAYLYTAAGEKADRARYKECKSLLKRSVSTFSSFRGTGRSMVISRMALCDNPETYLNGAMEIYRKLRNLHVLTASPFMVMAAMTLYEHGGLENADMNIARLETLYKAEQSLHPFLISDTDRGYLSLLIAFCDEPSMISGRIESCYEAAKTMSLDKDAVHSMAQVLSLSGRSVEESIRLVHELLDGLKANNHPVTKSNALPVLGALSMLDVPVPTLIQEIVEISDLLKDERGFRWYSCSGRTRTLYAALLVFMHHADKEGAELANGITGTMAMVMVEEIIMSLVIAMSVSTAHHTSSSSSSSGSH